MSFSSQDVAPQARHIKASLQNLAGISIPLETNKRIVVRCSNPILANTVAKLFRGTYHCEVAKGLKTNLSYVNVSFNYPF